MKKITILMLFLAVFLAAAEETMAQRRRSVQRRIDRRTTRTIEKVYRRAVPYVPPSVVLKKPLRDAPGYRYAYPLYKPALYRYRHHYYGWEPKGWAWPTTPGVGGYVWWNWNTPKTCVYYNPYGIYVRTLPYNYAAPIATGRPPEENLYLNPHFTPNSIEPAPEPAPKPVPAVQVPEAIATPQPLEGPE